MINPDAQLVLANLINDPPRCRPVSPLPGEPVSVDETVTVPDGTEAAAMLISHPHRTGTQVRRMLRYGTVDLNVVDEAFLERGAVSDHPHRSRGAVAQQSVVVHPTQAGGVRWLRTPAARGIPYRRHLEAPHLYLLRAIEM